MALIALEVRILLEQRIAARVLILLTKWVFICFRHDGYCSWIWHLLGRLGFCTT